jgi:ArsR family transcriptional regulator, arsenate/arsenite/antimonite-responsive transcriptional repressor
MTRTLATDPTMIVQGFHALSDATRVEILELLRGGERCQCELTSTLDAAQSRLSFHLKVLKEAGLVMDRREGRWVYYTLNTDALGKLGEFLSHVCTPAAHVRGQAACCD